MAVGAVLSSLRVLFGKITKQIIIQVVVAAIGSSPIYSRLVLETPRFHWMEEESDAGIPLKARRFEDIHIPKLIKNRIFFEPLNHLVLLALLCMIHNL